MAFKNKLCAASTFHLQFFGCENMTGDRRQKPVVVEFISPRKYHF